jgi:hypothetical protein
VSRNAVIDDREFAVAVNHGDRAEGDGGNDSSARRRCTVGRATSPLNFSVSMKLRKTTGTASDMATCATARKSCKRGHDQRQSWSRYILVSLTPVQSHHSMRNQSSTITDNPLSAKRLTNRSNKAVLVAAAIIGRNIWDRQPTRRADLSASLYQEETRISFGSTPPRFRVNSSPYPPEEDPSHRTSMGALPRLSLYLTLESV